MRRIWMGLFIAVLCLPLAFTIYLFAAAKLPALDRVTLALPMGVRAPVAEIAMSKTGHGKDSAKKMDRVLQLDPNNSAAWERRCTSARGERRNPKLHEGNRRRSDREGLLRIGHCPAGSQGLLRRRGIFQCGYKENQSRRC